MQQLKIWKISKLIKNLFKKQKLNEKIARKGSHYLKYQTKKSEMPEVIIKCVERGTWGMVNVLKIRKVKSEFRKGKYQTFCERSNQFCKGRQCKICYFPFLEWWGEKINLGCSFFFDVQNFRTFTVRLNWAKTRQNVSSGVSDQARHKLACAATESS